MVSGGSGFISVVINAPRLPEHMVRGGTLVVVLN